MSCSSGCPTPGAHATFGACLRAKALQIDRHSLATDARVEKDKDRRLGRYEDARRQGLHPKSTDWKHVRAAFEVGTADTVKSLGSEAPAPPSLATPTTIAS